MRQHRSRAPPIQSHGLACKHFTNVLSRENPITMISHHILSRIAAASMAIGCALCATSPAEAQRTEHYSVYAPPMKFGKWTKVGAHIGKFQVTVKVTPKGATRVFGEVRYYVNGRIMTKPFTGSVKFQTGNDIANVRVRLKGIPLGTACRVSVTMR